MRLEQLTAIPGVRKAFTGPVFNEFVLQTKISSDVLNQKLYILEIIKLGINFLQSKIYNCYISQLLLFFGFFLHYVISCFLWLKY